MTETVTSTKWTNRELKAIADPLVKKFKEIDQKLSVIKSRSAWHQKQHTELEKRLTGAKEGAGKLKVLPNKPKGDKNNAVDPVKLTVEVDSILKDTNTALATKSKVTYYYGTSSVDGASEIETKAKAALPTSDEKFASQAVHDAMTGSNPKDAAVAGKGVKHASAGTKGVGSCTIFFTLEDLDGGLEHRFTVVAVGGHAGPSSYKICESFTTKLKVGATVSL